MDFFMNIKMKLKELSGSKYFEITTLIIYTLIIYFSYLCFIQEYVYLPYKAETNYFRFILTLTIIILVYFVIKQVNNRDIEFYLKIFLCLMIIPISCVFTGRSYTYISYFAIIIQFMIIICTIIFLNKNVKENKFIDKIKKKISEYKKITTIIIFACFVLNTIIVLCGCLYYNGIPNLKTLNLENVYMVRSEFYLPKIINYLFIFETQFITIFFVIFFCEKKKYLLSVIFALIQLLFFLWKGDKISLFSLIFSVGVYIIYKYNNEIIDKMINIAFGITSVISIILYKVVPLLFGIFVMRLCITPAMLKLIYFDFFSKNPKIGWVGTVFNTVLKIPDPYIEMSYPNVIALEYFGKPDMYSSTGFLAEGYARFGWIGVLILPVIVGILLFVLSKKINNKNRAFIMGISILPFMLLNEKHLIPSLTFGSLLLLYIVLVFFDSKYIKVREDRFKISDRKKRK